MDEALEVVLKSWADEPFRHDGRYYRYPRLEVTPKPVQRPHPPLWIAATGMAGARRAARFGSPFYPNVPLPLIETARDAFLAEAEQLGREVDSVDQPLIRLVYCAEDHDQAWADSQGAILQVYRDDYRPWGFMVEVMPGGAVRTVREADDPAFGRERLSRDRLIVGDPDHCRREIERCRSRLGVNYIVFFCPPLLEHRRAMASLELFAREVMKDFV
jgi:alkanesulfonate monooxygenase SsuD/methylene tetrahydromethanopterin reductase-like flavin-dependent oxidoreductase (luciferase family)